MSLSQHPMKTLVLPFKDAEARTAIILGHADHGKSAITATLSSALRLNGISSSMFAADAVVFPALRHVGIYEEFQECYRDRKNYRGMWADMIAAYCRDDKARILRQAVHAGFRIVDGARRPDELYAALDEGLFDIIYWVDSFSRNKDPDPTMQIMHGELLTNPRRKVPLVYLDNGEEGADLEGLKLIGVYEGNI